MKNKIIVGIIGGTGQMGQWFKKFFEKNKLSEALFVYFYISFCFNNNIFWFDWNINFNCFNSSWFNS